MYAGAPRYRRRDGAGRKGQRRQNGVERQPQLQLVNILSRVSRMNQMIEWRGSGTVEVGQLNNIISVCPAHSHCFAHGETKIWPTNCLLCITKSTCSKTTSTTCLVTTLGLNTNRVLKGCRVCYSLTFQELNLSMSILEPDPHHKVTSARGKPPCPPQLKS